MKPSYFALAAALLLVGCDPYLQDTYQEQYLVESFMIAGEALPEVRVSRTAPFGSPYDFERQAISHAHVEIQLLKGDGEVEQAFRYRQVSPGVYQAQDTVARVIPRRTYALRITTPSDGQEISARTTIPDTFAVTRLSADTLQYQAVRFDVDITRSFYPGRQNIYIASVRSLDPEAHDLTPFYSDMGIKKEDVLINESGLFNEALFRVNEDHTITLPLPWVSIAFFGPNEITLFAMDDNMYDFWRSAAVQQPGTSLLSPGEIPNVISHVEGGTGLFAGLARSSHIIYVKRGL